MLRRLLRSFWYLCASLVVVAALLLSVARLALPMLEARESQLAALVRDTIGQDARIGGLQLSWRGLGPELRVTDFALLDKTSGRSLMSALEVRIGVDLWASLWAGQLLPSRLVVIGSDIGLYRDSNGRLAIEGVHIAPQTVNPWLLVLSQPLVELRDIHVQWRDELKKFPDLVISGVDLRLLNRGNRHQLQANLQLPGGYGDELTVAADLIGTPAQMDDWHGQFYIAARQAPLQQWLGERLPGGLDVAGILNMRLWGDMQGTRLQHLIGEVAITGPKITARADGGDLFNADRLSGQIDWQRAASGWTLDLDQVRLTEAAGLWPETGLTLAVVNEANGEHQVQLALGFLRLESVGPWLNYVLKLSPERQRLVEQLQVGGGVQSVQLAFRTRADWIEDLSYQFRFKDVHNTAVDRLPGSQNVSGRVVGNANYGVLDLDSHNGQMDLPRLFRDPLQFARLQGRIRWHHLPDRLRVETIALDAENADIATQSRMRLDVPADGSKPFLDLQTSFRRGRVEDAHKYLPAGIMPPATVKWLDRALVSGRVSSGAALFHGRLGDFPFDRPNGRFEVRATVTDAVLDYKEGWHRIEGLEAELAFVNRAMQIRGVAGQVLGSELSDVDVRIDDLTHAQLSIDGHARGELADMLRFLLESPIGKGAGGLMRDVQASGPAALQLGLRIPLAEHKSPAIDGRVQLNGNSLGMPDSEFSLDQLNGELRFSRESVLASNVSARLMDTKVRVDVEDAHLGKQAMSRLRVTGALPLIDRLQRGGGEFTKRFSGSADWTANLYLPKVAGSSGAAPHLELESELRGIAIDLPAPLGKPSDSARWLRLKTDILAQGLGPTTVHYADHSAAFQLSQAASGLSLSRGELKFGAGDARLPKDKAIRILGVIERFDWNQWRPVLAPAQATERTSAGIPALVDVNIEYLQAFEREFRQVEIKANRRAGEWRAQLKGPDAEGTLVAPTQTSQPIKATFERLRLAAAAAGEGGAQLDPAKVRALDIDVQQMTIHDLELGHVNLSTHPLADGLAVDLLSVDADWIKLAAHGAWTRRAGRDGSRFRIELKDGDLERLLSAFGYAGGIEGGQATGELDVNWPGTPGEFELAKLEGTLALRVGPGRLMNVDAGAGRVLGLFSLQGIRRRLALDFSDVFEKGFTFDRIDGHFTLLDSDAYTNDLVIEGPSARIEISGRTGLARQDYDQLVTVIPEVQSTLPIAGALAGGPVVGAALLLADKLFAKQMEGLTSFTRYQYTVTGSWQEPQFKPLPNDAGGADTKSKVKATDD